MCVNYFTENEDLYSIIANKIDGIDKNIKKIPTGWTNIVLDVKSNNDEYIVKLPRDEFWSLHTTKEVTASNFVRENMNIKTADMKVFYDKNRPFSVHKKIEGNSLTERIKDLKDNKLINIIKKIAHIFYTFHTFDINKIPSVLNYKYYDFISKLPKLDEKNYDFKYFDEMVNDEKKEEQVFIHGDLNIGNVILNNNDDVEAIIDYSFCGLGDIYTDLSIFTCRINEDLKNILIEEYEKVSNKKLDKGKLQNRIDLRKYIEKEYTAFMKKNHPEVQF